MSPLIIHDCFLPSSGWLVAAGFKLRETRAPKKREREEREEGLRERVEREKGIESEREKD